MTITTEQLDELERKANSSACSRSDQMTEVPSGCLACNHDLVRAFLSAHGANPDRLHRVPSPRHAWLDVVTCESCGVSWLVDKGN